MIFCPFALVSDEINEMAIFFYMIYTIYRDIIIIKIEIVDYNIGILQYLQFNEYICLYKNTLNEDLILWLF